MRSTALPEMSGTKNGLLSMPAWACHWSRPQKIQPAPGQTKDGVQLLNDGREPVKLIYAISDQAAERATMPQCYSEPMIAREGSM